MIRQLLCDIKIQVSTNSVAIG